MIYLSFPPAILSPNARPHWRRLAEAKKSYRMECFIEAKRQGVKKIQPRCPIAISLTFYPPDKRARDQDNMFAAMKSGLDGIADALGVDDRNFQLVYHVSPEPKNRVEVEIS
jgi:crossover junction endodeoxyribonuclease RusA